MKKIIYILLFLSALIQQGMAQNCPPIATCRGALTVSLQTNGDFLLWPEDIHEGGIPDSCKPVITLQLEITDRNQNVIHPLADSILLTCDDIGNDLIARLEVSNGQQTNSCWSELTVRDNFGYCENFGTDTIPILFNMYNLWRLPRGYLTATLNGQPLEEYKDGLFIMKREDILSGTNTIELDDDNGQGFGTISTLDVVVGMRMFFDKGYTPLRALIMDTDLSSSMTVKDLIYIREHVLGVRLELSDRKYVTLMEDFRFDPGFDRYDFDLDPYVIRFDGDTVDQVNFSFEVFSMADLNNAPDSLFTGVLEPRSPGAGILSFEDRWVEAGSPVEIPFTLEMTDGSPVYGFQFALATNSFSAMATSHGYAGNAWMEHLTGEQYRIHFASFDPVDEVAFRLLVTPKQSGYLSSLLSLSDEYFQEVVPLDIHSHGLSLRVAGLASGQLTAWPNPVGDLLEVSLPVYDSGSLSLMSTDGRTLRTVATGGAKQARMETADLAPGLYVLRWQSGDRVEMIKVIRQ